MRRSAWPVLVLLLASACRQSAAPPPAAAADPAPATPPASADAGLAQAAVPVKPVPAELPAVLARVNGETVERWELENAVRSAEANAGSPIPAGQRDEILRNLLNQLVEIRLLAQEARSRKLDPTAVEVKNQLDGIRKNFPSEDAFVQAMAADGTTVDKVQQDITRRLQISKLIDQEITPTLVVPAADVRAFYDQNLDRFKEDASVHASHILIAAPSDAGAPKREEARAKAEEILKKVRAGADFAQLARTESQDPGSASQGGDLGFFGQGQMVPPFDAAAFGLKPGAISEVVETQFGFHIIKQIEQRAPRTTPFEEARARIGEFLQAQQGEAKTAEMIEQLRAKATIEIYV